MASASGAEVLKWSFGLINSAGNYLTAETFGYRINCTGKSLKRKQIWYLEEAADGAVYIKSYLNRYLTVTEDGKFLGDAEAAGANQKLTIEPQKDGRWAIKSTTHGYYTGGNGDALTAFTKEIAEDRLWIVQLAMHPQVVVFNVNRKRYVHLADGTLVTDEDVPWGEDALVTLVFFPEGKYGLVASNGKYLAASGELVDDASDATKYILEFNGGKVSFKASTGKYLTALGSRGSLKATKDTIGKDEQFLLEDSHPQLKLTACNGKKVSIKGGAEVAAAQDETTDLEIFQVEPKAGKWAIKTSKANYWTVVEGGAIHSSATAASGANEQFTIEWHGAKIAIVASNGKYVVTKKNGQLAATSGEASEDAMYVFEIINRPKLIMRGEHGFIGINPSGLLECNKSVPTVFNLRVVKGECKISAPNGKFWKVGEHGVTATADEAETYYVQLQDNSQLLLQFNGKYFQGAQAGALTVTGTKADASTLWEY